MELPPQLKGLKKFMREAKRMEKPAPVVSHYCRMYAVIEAMKQPKSPDINAWLAHQMDYMEKHKVYSNF